MHWRLAYTAQNSPVFAVLGLVAHLGWSHFPAKRSLLFGRSKHAKTVVLHHGFLNMRSNKNPWVKRSIKKSTPGPEVVSSSVGIQVASMYKPRKWFWEHNHVVPVACYRMLYNFISKYLPSGFTGVSLDTADLVQSRRSQPALVTMPTYNDWSKVRRVCCENSLLPLFKKQRENYW